jgi:very-short-patch-repair endonuclease
MRLRTKGTIASIIGGIADRQQGVVARAQLLAAGLSSDVIGRAVRSGLLRPVFRGVYAVGHTALRREGWWMAGLLTCGDGATLSHFTAGTFWRLLHHPTRPIHVIVPASRGRKQRGIEPHRSRLHPAEVVRSDGLRVATPARTIVDLSSVLTPPSLRELVERAQDLRRFNPREIAASIERVPKRRGARELATLLQLLQPDAENARSYLERLFLPIVRRAKLPRPEVNVPIAGKRRDFVWREQRLVVETDGYRFHSSRAAMQRDRQRDRELTALGWRPARFTYEEVAFERARVGVELATLLAVPRRAVGARD